MARGLGKFVLSSALASLTALIAAALALYGVFRQVEATGIRERRVEAADRGARYAEHFRWVSELVLGSRAPEDIRVIEFLIEDLFNRAPTEEDEDAALALLDRHQARIKEVTPVADTEDTEADAS